MKYLTFFLLAAVVATAACRELPKDTLDLNRDVTPVRRKPVDKKFPHHVGILLKDSDSELSWCGGSLINPEFVLTAAHCVKDIEEATLYLGSSQRESGEVVHKVSKQNFIIHPKWDEDELVNDIALVRIPSTPSTSNIDVAALPDAENSKSRYIGELVLTSGWGHASNSSMGLSNDLQWSYMGVISNKECSKYYGTAIKSSHICITSYGALSTCRADTGGGLILDSNETLIGVSSFGPRKGCEKGVPLVYTRVSPYRRWINRYVVVHK